MNDSFIVCLTWRNEFQKSSSDILESDFVVDVVVVVVDDDDAVAVVDDDDCSF